MEYIDKLYNELTIKEYIKPPKDVSKYKSWNSKTWVRCTCSCGNTDVKAPLNAVRKGYVKSCGHLRKQKACTLLDTCRNSTHSAINLTFNNETHNIAEWSRITGIPRTTIMHRLSKEMPIEKILEMENKDEQHISTI